MAQELQKVNGNIDGGSEPREQTRHSDCFLGIVANDADCENGAQRKPVEGTRSDWEVAIQEQSTLRPLLQTVNTHLPGRTVDV